MDALTPQQAEAIRQTATDLGTHREFGDRIVAGIDGLPIVTREAIAQALANTEAWPSFQEQFLTALDETGLFPGPVGAIADTLPPEGEHFTGSSPSDTAPNETEDQPSEPATDPAAPPPGYEEAVPPPPPPEERPPRAPKPPKDREVT